MYTKNHHLTRTSGGAERFNINGDLKLPYAFFIAFFTDLRYKLCECMCVHICIYIYMYISIHTYKHTHTQMHTRSVLGMWTTPLLDHRGTVFFFLIFQHIPT